MRSIDAKDLNTKFSNASKKRINGKNISKTQKDEYLIMSAVEKLVDKNLTSYTTTDSLTSEAINLLSTVNITIDTTLSGDLDLKKTTTDSETINNPNIEDKNLKNLKNKKTSFLTPMIRFTSLVNSKGSLSKQNIAIKLLCCHRWLFKKLQLQ